MPKLSDVVPSRAWLSVPIGSALLRVSYRPGVVTPRLQKAVAAARDTSDLDAGLLDPVSRLLDSWDLTDDDDRPVPITPDALADVPASILLAILTAIGEDMQPDPSRRDDLRNGSSPGSSALAPTGTSS